MQELDREAGITPEKISYIARELAMNIYELPDILEFANVSMEEFEGLKDRPYFLALLKNELATWGSSLNVTERVKVKAQYIVEDWLKVAARDANNPNEPLAARSQVMRIVTGLAGMGGGGVEAGGPSDRFVVNINLGEDKKLHYEKEIKVVEGKEVGSE